MQSVLEFNIFLDLLEFPQKKRSDLQVSPDLLLFTFLIADFLLGDFAESKNHSLLSCLLT